MTEVEQPPQNGIDLSANEDDDNSKARPADIEQDMREMERRKRVEAIMGSKLFREELERIVDSARDSGNADGILQQLSDIVGVPATRVGSVFRASNCMQPINDIRGVESMGYAKGEKILRCKLAATFRLLDLYGWTQGLGAQITARLKVDQEYFLVNPYGLLYHEITASSLNKVDMQGNIVEQGTTNFGVNKSHFVLHSIVHAARPDIRCIIYIGCSPVVAISSLKAGLLPLTKDACVLGEITSHAYAGCLVDQDEREKLVRNLGPNSKVMLLTNHGALCCGETIEEAFFAACHIVQACETQLKLLPVGLDNLVLIPEESRKTIYEQSRSPPEDLAKKFAAAAAITTAGDSNKAAEEEDKKEGEEKSATTKVLGQTPKWRVGGAEFEALMRMLDNAGYRTGYIYRHPLIKSEPPKPKNDVELPPAVSSLGYLLEEEELFRQGIWKKGVAGKGGDRSRWLNSPNVYQKVEVLETGTPDPKKITKWVAEGSPTHSTPVRIDDPLQFVPVNTNPKEFKRVQQQIKDNRRADKISAGPQSHILEGVTWDEANRLKDATVSQTGDHVVLMGAASKGIIQRGFQHNATVYKAPYAKNPFDNVTDDELNEYKRTVERKKKSIHGEYTDTDFSESEALSSLQTSGAQQQTKQNTTTTTTTAAVSQSEPEDVSEHQVMRIETQQAPVPSQPEVVLSDATLSFINGERSHTATNRKPPTGRDNIIANNSRIIQDPICHIQDTIDLTASQSIAITTTTSSSSDHSRDSDERKFQNLFMKNKNITTPGQHHRHAFDTNFNNSHSNTTTLFHEMQTDALFNRQKRKQEINHNNTPIAKRHSPGYSDRISPHKIPPHRRSPFTEAPTQPQSTVNNSSDNAFSLYSIKTNETRFDSLIYDYPNLENTSNIYDYTNDVEEDFQKGSIFTLKRSTFLISPKCSSPKICKPILESLDKPSNLQEHYVNAHSPLDLIWNIPIRRHYSPCPTPELANTPRKEKKGFKNSPSRQPRSPYRTLSHFGFNSPQRQPQPEHKHVPPPAAKKYKPLRRSISYEEIFSSVRYIDLCEHCFEQIVRYKPELMHYRIKLRNLREFYQGGEDVEKEKEEAFNLDSNEKEDFTAFVATPLAPLIEVEERDSSESHRSAKSSSSPTAPHSSFLEKITRMNYSEISSQTTTPQFQMALHQTLEQEFQNLKIEDEDVEKRDENENQTRISIMEILDFNNFLGNLDGHENPSEDNLPQELSSSSFTRNCSEDHSRRKLVFEEELWEENQVDDTENPGEILSHISAGNGTGDLEEEILNELNSEDHNPRDFENSQQSLPNSSSGMGAVLGGDDKDVNLPHSSSSSSTPRSLMDREERLRRKLIFQELWGEDHVDYFGNLEAGAFTLSDNNGAQLSDRRDQEKLSSPRSLMDREERTRRKLIFQELWEDHVEYFGNREELLNATAAAYSGNSGGQGGGFSDTESAIDETNNNTQRGSRLPNSHENPQEEMFLTQSRVISPKTLGGPRDNEVLGNILANQELNENYDEEKQRDDDILSSCSKLTYDISDGHSSSSEENILQRSFGQTNFLKNKQNSTRKEEDIEEGSAKDFNSSPRQDGFQENFVAENTKFNANLDGNPEILSNLKKSKIFINDQNAEAALDVEAPKSMQYTSKEANKQNVSETNLLQEAKLVGKQMTFHNSNESHDIIENITGPATTPCDNSKFYEFLDENLGNTNVVNLTSQITFPKSNESSDIREEELNDNGAKRCNNSKFDESVPPKSFVLEKNENPNLKTQNISAGKEKVQIQEVVIIRPHHDAFEELEGKDMTNFYSPHNLTSVHQEFPVNEEVSIPLPGTTETCETLENKNLSENLDIVKEAQPNLKNLQNSSFPSTSQNQEGHIETQTQALVRYKSGLLNTLVIEKDTSNTENPSPDSDEDFKDILRRIENLQNKDRFSKDKEEGGQDSAAAGNTQLESSSRPTNFEFPQGNLSAKGDNKENCCAETELSSMEVEILKKIEEHQLKKSEEIFNKIENSIRNKLTPSKLEMLIKEQWLSLYNQDEKTASSCRNILPEIAPTIFSTPQTGGQLSSRRSRSLTPLSDNTIPPKQKLNKTTTPLGDMERRNPLHLTDDNTPQQHKLTPCSSSSSSLKSFKSSSSKTRNFILENIRNVSKPRCGGNVASNQVKRLQGNSQAIFGRNPFGPRPSSSSMKSPRKNGTPLAKTPSSPVCSTNVYSFQSKLVRGSPRFWVSLTPPTLSSERRRSINKTPRTSKKTQPKKYLAKEKTLSSPSTPPGFSSHVDAEINALGQQIQQIHPRLENYKRKLDDFGDRVAKCARNMDECISAQEEIVCDQAEFKEAMTMQQYVDEIICRVDTFSLSETED